MAEIDFSFAGAKKPHGEFFRDGNEPTSDIAAMFVSIGDAGQMPKEMRKALLKHAENVLTDTPRNLAALARAVAAASQEGWMGKTDMASAAYGLAQMAEAMQGYAAMWEHLTCTEEMEARHAK